MNQLILVSHGHFAKETVNTLELIVGDMAKDIETVSVTKGRGPEEVYAELKELLDQHSDRNIFVFCDIYGGTPFNIALRLMLEEYPIHVFTGFNLPILLEIVLKKEASKEEMLESIQAASENSFVYVNEQLKEEDDEDVY